MQQNAEEPIMPYIRSRQYTNIMQMTGFYKKQRLQKQKKPGNKPETAFFTTLFNRIGLLLTCERQMAA